MSHQRVHIFLNGEFPETTILNLSIHPDEQIIAVDGGYRHLSNLGLSPSVLIGDLDSIPADDLKTVEAATIRVLRFAAEKDQSDFELALDEALRLRADQVFVYAALGGRIDHTLANLAVMSADKYIPMDLVFIHGRERIRVIRKSLQLSGHEGDLVSLLPWQGPATGVQTSGLLYPLNNETLFSDSSRGLSNVMTTNKADISIKTGRLLCIHLSE